MHAAVNGGSFADARAAMSKGLTLSSASRSVRLVLDDDVPPPESRLASPAKIGSKPSAKYKRSKSQMDFDCKRGSDSMQQAHEAMMRQRDADTQMEVARGLQQRDAARAKEQQRVAANPSSAPAPVRASSRAQAQAQAGDASDTNPRSDAPHQAVMEESPGRRFYEATIWRSEDLIGHIMSGGEGHRRVYESLQQLGADSPYLAVRDEHGWGPVHLAAQRGDVKLLQAFASYGCDVYERTASGQDAGTISASKGHKALSRFLAVRAEAGREAQRRQWRGERRAIRESLEEHVQECFAQSTESRAGQAQARARSMEAGSRRAIERERGRMDHSDIGYLPEFAQRALRRHVLPLPPPASSGTSRPRSSASGAMCGSTAGATSAGGGGGGGSGGGGDGRPRIRRQRAKAETSLVASASFAAKSLVSPGKVKTGGMGLKMYSKD
jgi:hypothetical protein